MDKRDLETVLSKKKKKQKKKENSASNNKRPRPVTLAIKVAKGKSYSDVVLGIQEKVNTEDHGVAIRNVTKTRNGNVLIEMGKTDKGADA